MAKTSEIDDQIGQRMAAFLLQKLFLNIVTFDFISKTDLKKELWQTMRNLCFEREKVWIG